MSTYAYEDDLVFVTVSCGDRGEASIAVREIAAMESHTVVSYSYEDWTLVTLRSGKTIDCRIRKSDLISRLQNAMARTTS